MAVPNHESIVQGVYAAGSYDLRTREGCGRLVEAAVPALHAVDRRWGYLKKTGGTMYNGHSHDGALYLSDTPGQSQHVDFIAAAESQNPNETPHINWNPDIPRYSASDWYAPSGVVTPPTPVPPGMTRWTPGHTALLNMLNLGTVPSPAKVVKAAQQFAFTFPGEGWCAKKKQANWPDTSSDVMARQIGPELIGFRILPFQGGVEIPLPSPQVAVPVQPIDHLGGGVVPTPGPGPTPNPPPIAPTVKPYVGDQKANKLSEMMDKDYRKGGHEHGLNAGAGQWFGMIYADYHAGMEWDAAVAKHRATWCSILRIEPT